MLSERGPRSNRWGSSFLPPGPVVRLPLARLALVSAPSPTHTERVRDEARWWLVLPDVSISTTCSPAIRTALGGDPTRYYDETMGRECLEYADTILRFAREELHA